MACQPAAAHGTGASGTLHARLPVAIYRHKQYMGIQMYRYKEYIGIKIYRYKDYIYRERVYLIKSKNLPIYRYKECTFD